MMENTNSLIMLTQNPINNVNSNYENVVAINLKLFYFSFLEIVETKFKMKLQVF